MAFDFSIFESESGREEQRLDERFVDWLVNERAVDIALHYEKLWSYYSNDMQDMGVSTLAPANNQVSESSRPYRQAQEYGLPSRITGVNRSFYGGIRWGTEASGIQRKEVVIENDIAWRIDTIVDFLFGKRMNITSRATDSIRAKQIQEILNTVFEANGGTTYFQQLGLLGSIYGFVDVILRWNEHFLINGGRGGNGKAASAATEPRNFNEVLERTKQIFLEVIESPRSLPILNENNYRKTDYYIQHYWQQHNQLSDEESLIKTVNHWGKHTGRQKETHNVEIISNKYWQRYQDGELIAQGINPFGVVPVVHIQNMPLPLHYEGQSDVEPLIPLQDELNTRLSDRASRITFQSFKMYLGKGIEGFEDRVVAPGRMWSTENPEAAIEEFGGDAGSPSEMEHIRHVREALDKASGVASIAAGILKGRIGNLTSAVALKMTLMGVLAKTERKRRSYGAGIAEICRLILLALDKTGIYPNKPDEREIEIHWPSPLPENLMEKLQEANLKRQLGVPREQILKELGYSEKLKDS
ncbi:MAG: hypothetical protein AMJ79_06740 [Phycisphaerae bacterium SM23_30]|nr:MAG: hypothetical protein AMJ79_06740 [Phycisphaerae bacterium SM23_30]